jgi:hypothetical protein
MAIQPASSNVNWLGYITKVQTHSPYFTASALLRYSQRIQNLGDGSLCANQAGPLESRISLCQFKMSSVQASN